MQSGAHYHATERPGALKKGVLYCFSSRRFEIAECFFLAMAALPASCPPDHSFMWADAQKSPVISGGAKAWSYLTV